MAAPQRIVSLVPSHTESLHDLGLAKRVVGRTRFCIAPKPWVDGIPHVGGTKDADLQKILALKPDLVVVDKDENPLALVEAIQAAGIRVLHSEIDTVQDAADFLRVLAGSCGAEPAGEREASRIESALAGLQSTHPLPVFCPIWYEPWMTFNATAYPHAMLAAAGFENAFGERDGPKYFEVSADDVACSTAEAVLLPTEPFPFDKQIKRVEVEGLGKAGKNAVVIDGEALTWFGTRTAAGLAELARVRRQFNGAGEA